MQVNVFVSYQLTAGPGCERCPCLWTPFVSVPLSICTSCSRWSEEDPVSGGSAENSRGGELLTGRPADAQRFQDVERWVHVHTHTHTLYTVCALQWLSATKCRETSQHLLICLWFVCRSEEHLPSAIDEQPPHGPEVQEDLCCAVCQGNTLKQYRPLWRSEPSHTWWQK